MDAWRCSNNSEHEDGLIADAKTIYTMTKAIEMITESIPSSVIQLSAIVTHSGETTSTAWFSMVFCVCTASFASATLSYDWDTNKENRKLKPWFYGYVPDSLKQKVRT